MKLLSLILVRLYCSASMVLQVISDLDTCKSWAWEHFKRTLSFRRFFFRNFFNEIVQEKFIVKPLPLALVTSLATNVNMYTNLCGAVFTLAWLPASGMCLEVKFWIYFFPAYFLVLLSKGNLIIKVNFIFWRKICKKKIRVYCHEEERWRLSIIFFVF